MGLRNGVCLFVAGILFICLVIQLNLNDSLYSTLHNKLLPLHNKPEQPIHFIQNSTGELIMISLITENQLDKLNNSSVILHDIGYMEIKNYGTHVLYACNSNSFLTIYSSVENEDIHYHLELYSIYSNSFQKIRLNGSLQFKTTVSYANDTLVYSRKLDKNLFRLLLLSSQPFKMIPGPLAGMFINFYIRPSSSTFNCILPFIFS
jgi:hypothetical protein